MSIRKALPRTRRPTPWRFTVPPRIFTAVFDRVPAVRGRNSAETTGAFDDLVNWVVNGVAPAGDDILDPETVAAPHFGCQFTTEARPEDPYHGTYIIDDPTEYWICECWEDSSYEEPRTWYPEADIPLE